MDKQHHVDGGDSPVSPGFWSNPTRVLATVLLTGAMAGFTVSAALAEGPSSYSVAEVTPHLMTNIAVIMKTANRI